FGVPMRLTLGGLVERMLVDARIAVAIRLRIARASQFVRVLCGIQHHVVVALANHVSELPYWSSENSGFSESRRDISRIAANEKFVMCRARASTSRSSRTPCQPGKILAITGR